MKIITETEEVSLDSLNSALSDFSKVLNQHFVASGNKIHLQESGAHDYNKNKSDQPNRWIVKVSIEWEGFSKK